ncbi:MAG: hypothetical protein AB3N28_08830 [Kordiimonas sp.]
MIAVIFRKCRTFEAIIWSTLGAYLFLPTGVGLDFPLLPPVEKTLIANASVLIFSLWLLNNIGTQGRSFRHTTEKPRVDPVLLPIRGFCMVVGAVVCCLILSSVATVATNSEPLFYGPLMIPGLKMNDIFSLIVEGLIAVIPFLLAVRFLNKPDHHFQILRALSLFGLVYSALMLIEIRMSPQLNSWLYGFFPHSFFQHFRDGSWRPIVFLAHGLRVGIYISMAVLASLALWRQTRRILWLMIAIWLTFILFLSKNTGAFSLALLFSPVLILTGVRVQILLAVCVAVTVLLYPMLRGAGFIPTISVLEIAESINPARAQSLEYRLTHEDALLARAKDKLLFGWGSWGRPQIHDPVTGLSLSVTDGIWIILIGAYGWFGYIIQFGMLTLPLILLFLCRSRLQVSFVTTGLSIILATNLIDLIPNSSLTPVTYLVAGALLGSVLYPQKGEYPISNISYSNTDTQMETPTQIYVRHPRS